MFKVNASNLNNALECAAVGGGKGFVLFIDPEMKKVAEKKKVQLVSVSSSDGEKTGLVNVVVHVSNMEKPEVYYASASLKQAVATLAKVTDIIYVESKGSYLQVSDEKKEAVVRVELLEKDIVLPLPKSPENTMMITINREKFVNAIRLGGYSAEESHIAGVDTIGFQVKEAEKKLIVMSRSSTTTCKATMDVEELKNTIEGSENTSEKSEEWHLVNFRFIQSMAQKLSGDLIQIAFTPKFMVVRSANAVFGVKKSEGTIPNVMIEMLNTKDYDYAGTLSKKDLLVAMEIAMVGTKDSKERITTLETNENGTLKVSSVNGSNKSNVSQKSHEGRMEDKSFYIDILKKGLNGCGDELHYFGKVEPVFLLLDGTDAGVDYVSVISPINKRKAK